MVPNICSEENCDDHGTTRGLCKPHYAKRARQGRLPDRLTTEQRFWAKVSKTDECWDWVASRNIKGYGQFNAPGVTQLAHRYSYTLAHGPIPDDKMIDHTCHTPACVNPAHLRVVTPGQNAQNRAGASAASNTGIRGVGWHEEAKKWRAFVVDKGRYHHAGLFLTKPEAEAAVIAKRNELFTHNEIDRRTSR